jgi:putative DNA base modification enzyme with NMAD domain
VTLYSYCLRFDGGDAPNPYWGTCTLAICKPAIRRVAKKDDWIVGLGSKNSPIGDISTSVVYAMRVTKVMSMAHYDSHCKKSLPGKIPDWSNSDFRRKVGDCIYEYGRPGRPRLRPSIHTQANRKTDLRGRNVLLSKHFYYFGDRPAHLPKGLLPIIHGTQGHKSRANKKYLEKFVSWIEAAGWNRNRALGEPQRRAQILSIGGAESRSLCSKQDQKEGELDEIC